MDVLKDVMRNGPIAPFSNWTKGIFISVFTAIVITLMIMLVVLLRYELYTNIQFGY